VTNSDHVRDAATLRAKTGAKICGPNAERDKFPIDCDVWLTAGGQHLSELAIHEMSGSKTPGELALLLEERTLVTGDLVRSHAGGRLDLLPRAKLLDPGAALESVRSLLKMRQLDAILPGDGWPVFRDARPLLAELIGRIEQEE